MSEMLKTNNTLKSLDLRCEEERKREKRKDRNDELLTDNGIGIEGAKSMSEALKSNTTLKSLDLGCEEE